MNRSIHWTRLSAALLILALAVVPGQISAQGGPWPPLEVQTGMETQDKLVRFDVLLKNVSNVDLVDVLVNATLPAGAAFVSFQPVSYAITGFDGQEMSYSVIKVPASP